MKRSFQRLRFIFFHVNRRRSVPLELRRAVVGYYFAKTRQTGRGTATELPVEEIRPAFLSIRNTVMNRNSDSLQVGGYRLARRRSLPELSSIANDAMLSCHSLTHVIPNVGPVAGLVDEFLRRYPCIHPTLLKTNIYD